MHIFCSFLHWTSQNITAEPQNDVKLQNDTTPEPTPKKWSTSHQNDRKRIQQMVGARHIRPSGVQNLQNSGFRFRFSPLPALSSLNFALLANILYLYYAILDLYCVCTYTCAIPKLSQPPPLPPLCSFSVYSECSAVSMLSIC